MYHGLPGVTGHEDDGQAGGERKESLRHIAAALASWEDHVGEQKIGKRPILLKDRLDFGGRPASSTV